MLRMPFFLALVAMAGCKADPTDPIDAPAVPDPDGDPDSAPDEVDSSTTLPGDSDTATACVPGFPGDPSCSGTMYYGASTEGGDPTALEQELGHPLVLFRSYMDGDDAASKFVSRASDDLANGRLPLISTKLPGSWAEVAAGAHDGWLIERIDGLAALPGPVWLCLHHEPTHDGPPEDWIAMQQHARTLIDAHSTNIALVGILNGWDFQENDPHPEVWNHPPGTGVHVMGFDSYNGWSETNGIDWKTVEYTFSPGVTIAGWGYPTVVGEHGVRTDPADPGKAAQWMRDAYDFAHANGFAGLSYFDSGANSPDGTWALDEERLPVFRELVARPETAHL